jgi:hypothetical protein
VGRGGSPIFSRSTDGAPPRNCHALEAHAVVALRRTRGSVASSLGGASSASGCVRRPAEERPIKSPPDPSISWKYARRASARRGHRLVAKCVRARRSVRFRGANSARRGGCFLIRGARLVVGERQLATHPAISQAHIQAPQAHLCSRRGAHTWPFCAQGPSPFRLGTSNPRLLHVRSTSSTCWSDPAVGPRLALRSTRGIVAPEGRTR